MTQTLDRRTFIGAAATFALAAPFVAKAQSAASLTLLSAPTSITGGGVFQATFRVTAGSTALLSGGPNPVRIGAQNPQDNFVWNTTARVNLPADVPANTSRDVVGTFTAPAGSGTYPFAWRLVQEFVAWFGNTVSQNIVVSDTGTPPPPGDDQTFVTSGDGGNNVAEGGASAAGGANSRTGPGAGGAFAWGQGAQALGGGAVAFGRGAKAMHTDTFVVGQGCVANADNARAAGWVCHSYGPAGYAHGYQASDRGTLGLEAYSSGSWTGTEDLGSAKAQTCRAVLRAQTSDATPTPLTTDGRSFGYTNQIRLPDDASYVLQWLVVARDIANGDSRAWKVLTLAIRNIGAPVVVSTPVITDVASSPGANAWGVSVTADTYNGAVQLNGIGSAGRPIQWVTVMIDGENVG